MKLTFVKLVKLVDLSYDGETAEARERWLRNVKASGVENGYTIDSEITKEFNADEVDFDTVECYNFMGSAFEEERFYDAAWVTVKEKATGDYYALATEYFDEF